MTLGRAAALVMITVLAVTAVWCWHLASSLESARLSVATMRGAIKQQQDQARDILAKRTAERDALQKTMDERHVAQGKQDASNAKTIATQADRLVALTRAAGRGLRDPNAVARCGRRDTPGAAAPDLAPSAGDTAEAPGLLSVPLERLLLRLAAEADDINAAYASCRADALNLRGLAEPAPSPLPPPDKEPP